MSIPRAFSSSVQGACVLWHSGYPSFCLCHPSREAFEHPSRLLVLRPRGGPASCDIPVIRRSAFVLRPGGLLSIPRAFSSSVQGACGAVRPFRGYPSHASDTPPIGDCRGPRSDTPPIGDCRGPRSDTPPIGDCRGPRSDGAGPFRSHGRGRPCRPQAPGLQPIRRRVLRLPDASLSPSAGSRRFQNDSCGQFACAVCHEMKKQPCLFILWHDFSQFCPKHGHEMNNCCDSFISCPGRWDNEGGTVQLSSALLSLCPRPQLRTFAHSSSRKKALDVTRPWRCL